MADETKNNEYWMKRRKNNEAARRSREKRRMNDLLLERRVMQLTEENKLLKNQLLSIKIKYGELDDVKYTSDSFVSAQEGFHQNESFNDVHLDLFDDISPDTLNKELKSGPSSNPKQPRFTSRVITNATGDTSATVLVNSADSANKSHNLSPLSFNNNFTRIMSKSGKSPLREENLQFSSSSPRQQLIPQSRDFSIRQKLSDKLLRDDSHENEESSRQSRNFDFMLKESMIRKSEHSELMQESNEYRSESLSSMPWINPSLLGTFSPPIIKLLRDLYNSYETHYPKYVPVVQTKQPFPVELLLHQIQSQIGKSQKTLSKESLPNFQQSSDIEETSPEISRKVKDLEKSPTSRHSSTDSGFDGAEENYLTEALSPLSPPPSPELGKRNQTHLYEKAYNKQQTKKIDDLSKFSRSRSVTVAPQIKELDYSRKRKSEFQLPHKLRLKKSSITNEAQLLAYDPDCSKESKSPYKEESCFLSENFENHDMQTFSMHRDNLSSTSYESMENKRKIASEKRHSVCEPPTQSLLKRKRKNTLSDISEKCEYLPLTSALTAEEVQNLYSRRQEIGLFKRNFGFNANLESRNYKSEEKSGNSQRHYYYDDKNEHAYDSNSLPIHSAYGLNYSSPCPRTTEFTKRQLTNPSVISISG